MRKSIIDIPDALHPDSEFLVKNFAQALAIKLLRNQQKYGWTNEWATRDWEEECRAGLMTHIEKGDPQDVAIYAAFMWFRSWKTNQAPSHGNIHE